MFSFFKRKKTVSRVPQWSRVANASEYVVFKKAVQKYFENKDVSLDFEDGVVKLDDKQSFGVNVINLIALYKHCLNCGNSDSYQATVEEFLGNLRKSAHTQ